MVTVRNAILMQDRMHVAMSGMISITNNLINHMERLDVAVDKAAAAGDWSRMRSELAGLDNVLGTINTEMQQMPAHQARVARGFESWQGAIVAVNSAIGLVQSAASGISKITNIIDQNTANTARLGLINDGLQTTAQLQNDVFMAAERSRGSYNQMQQSVAKLGLLAGDAFSSNREIVSFTETLNKAFVVGGASTTEQASGTYQLMQAMSSGRLQGDEYRSIIENAPMLAHAIEDYMRNVQHAKGSMKDWAADSLLTADVIKAALFGAADDINAKFEEMPVTFAQAWQSMLNKLLKAAQPMLAKWSKMFNSTKVQNSLNKIAQMLINVMDVVMDIINFLVEHRAIIYGFLSTIIVMIGSKMVGAIAGFVGGVRNAITAIKGATTAQELWNAACNTNALLAIISAVLTLIMVLKDLYGTSPEFNLWVHKLKAGFGVVLNHIIAVGEAIRDMVVYLKDPVLAFSEAFEKAGQKTDVDWAKAILDSYQEMNPLVDGSVFDTSALQDPVADALREQTDHNMDYFGMNRIAAEAAAQDYVIKNIINKEYNAANDAILAALEAQTETQYGIGEDVSNIASTVDLSKEQLQYLVEGFTADYINNINLQSPAPNVVVNMNGNITDSVDADKLYSDLGLAVMEANAAGADLVYDF